MGAHRLVGGVARQVLIVIARLQHQLRRRPRPLEQVHGGHATLRRPRCGPTRAGRRHREGDCRGRLYALFYKHVHPAYVLGASGVCGSSAGRSICRWRGTARRCRSTQCTPPGAPATAQCLGGEVHTGVSMRRRRQDGESARGASVPAWPKARSRQKAHTRRPRTLLLGTHRRSIWRCWCAPPPAARRQ